MLLKRFWTEWDNIYECVLYVLYVYNVAMVMLLKGFGALWDNIYDLCVYYLRFSRHSWQAKHMHSKVPSFDTENKQNS
jgi:hypothetical protein